jgi:peptidyl-prolyl cis-trans isomerase C
MDGNGAADIGSGLATSSTTQVPPPPAADAGAVKPVPAQLPDVLARVNGEVVSRSEFERAVGVLEKRAGRPVPADQRDRVYRGVLDNLIGVRLLTQEAQSRKVTVTDAEVDQRIDALKKQFKTEDDFNKALSDRGVSLATLRTESRKELAVAKMLEAEIKPKISVNDGDVKTFYDQNPKQFQQPEAFRASHILIRVESAATPEQKKDARSKAEALLKQVQGGADFAALARENSQDGSASNGGDLNYFGRGQMVPAFEQAVVALKPGEVSGVVESPFGYHIIKLADHRAARTVPLAEVSARIGQFLVMQAQQREMVEFVRGLRSKGKVEVLI